MSGHESTRQVQDAVANSVQRRTARVTFSRMDHLSRAPASSPREGWLASVGQRLMRRLLRALDRAAAPVVQEGMMDFVAGRCGMADGARSVLITGDRLWTGKPGTPREAAEEEPAISLQPLWVFDLCRGVVTAEAIPEDAVGCEGQWEHHRAEADLREVRASVAYEVGRPFAATSHVRPKDRVAFDAWIDSDMLIRRVRVHTALVTELTLELGDFGVDIPEEYWTTLPARDTG